MVYGLILVVLVVLAVDVAWSRRIQAIEMRLLELEVKWKRRGDDDRDP